MATPQTTPDGPDADTTLSERDSKALLADYGVPIAAERVVGDAASAGAAADELGYPVVAKLNGDAIAHKTERGLVKLRLGDRPRGRGRRRRAARRSDTGRRRRDRPRRTDDLRQS